ncbi:MAG: CHASE2 domain-containing protein [Oscillatoriales cyanobacterium RM1_1_9]|nr:CHASE2 domain-containing protein [Oscillatoriales cyanobacterium RM1_1_9]
MGLGRSLADLQIPQLIVMREPVPDRVAQEFLTYWVTAFSQGKPFYQSVREARERLQGLEGEFPCACWLPVICQNPTAIPPTWQQLQHGREPIRLRDLLGRLQYPPVLGGLITVAVLGIRLLGGLETFELRAFDHLMRSRPSEAMDSRLLLITVTGNDVQAQDPQKRQGASLSNEAFDQLLKQLIPLKPRVIGVDIYREIPLGDRYPALLQQFQQNNRLINLCKVGDDANNPGIPPALEIPQPQIQSRVGFSDVVTDSDNVVRRHLLGMSFPENSACKVTTSLNLMLTMRYLSDEGIAFSTTSSQLQLGDLTLKEGREILTQNSGGYSRLDNYWGYQIMLNYRNTHSIAPEVTLTEALEGKRLTPELVRDKIVLIGTTDPHFGICIKWP